MDEYQLRNAISELRSECSQLERENSEMRQDINALGSSAAAAANALVRTREATKRVLDDSVNVIEYSDRTLQEVTAEQEHISVLYRGFKNIETANKKIRELTNNIYFEFANFRMVRKIVRAFIDNIHLDVVNPEVIYKSVEKEHLQSPDFWLSCSMLAIMHWKENDQAAAERAMQKALELDEHQAILFFMSFNLLLGRKDAALKWFECYQRIEKTGDDAAFILLLLHATNLREDTTDTFSKRIREFLTAEYEASRSMNDHDELVELVKSHLVQYNSSDTFVFDSLRGHIKDYATMAKMLTMAKDNEAILEFVETTNSASRGRGYIYIERFINELLDAPDKKERVYTDEIAYNEAIIKHVGDLAAAHEDFSQKHEHDISALNVMSECVHWLFGRESNEITEVARSNLFLLCRDLVEEAAERYFAEYREMDTNSHPVAIRDYTTTMNFEDKANELKKVEAYYNEKRDRQLLAVTNKTLILYIVLAVLTAIGGFFLHFVVSLVALVGFGLAALFTYFSNNKKRLNIIASAAEALEKVKLVIETLFTDYDRFRLLYEEHDRIADDILFAIRR